MPLVQLKMGNMFDGPSDLIVLPCSTSGTITPFVRDRLAHHKIPFPKPGMKLGDVSIMPFKGGEHIAQYVGFAASVKADWSSETAIHRIGAILGQQTKKKSTIRRVSAPLLGAGAGRLPAETVVRAMSAGFKSSAHRDACLVIHVLQENLFKVLSVSSVPLYLKGSKHYRRKSGVHILRDSGVSALPKKPLRVFISYCHSTQKHEKWVENIGVFLRKSGIEARLDIWHLRRGMDLPQFMTNELALAQRVILISDEKYAEKADGRLGGVGWETMIVQGDMATLPANSTKYLVIVRTKEIQKGLPKYLRTKFVIHWTGKSSEKRNCQTLLHELYNVVKIPPIGPKPVFV
jgi:hypothetical protein